MLAYSLAWLYYCFIVHFWYNVRSYLLPCSPLNLPVTMLMLIVGLNKKLNSLPLISYVEWGTELTDIPTVFLFYFQAAALSACHVYFRHLMLSPSSCMIWLLVGKHTKICWCNVNVTISYVKSFINIMFIVWQRFF